MENEGALENLNYPIDQPIGKNLKIFDICLSFEIPENPEIFESLEIPKAEKTP